MSSTSASGGKRRSSLGSQRKRGGKRRPQGVKGWALWLLKWGVVSFAALLVLIVVVLFIAYQRTKIPNPNKAFQTQTSFVYYSDGKTQVGKFAEQNRVSIPYSQMPTCMKQAVVAAENKSFWTDKGVDPKGIVRAFFNNAQGGSTQGASTITQEYVKVLYLNQQRTYTRKIKEAFLALKLQRTETKQQILEGYLNTIYFGRGAYGVQAAAQAFFNKPASKLSTQQCAVLTSTLNNPSRFSPDSAEGRAHLLTKYRSVLNAMASMHYITQSEASDEGAALPKFPTQKVDNANGGQTGFMKDLVHSELISLGFTDSQIQGGGLRITSTFQKGAMQAAEEAVLDNRPTTAKDGSKITDKQLHVAVASVVPGTGALVGFYGGQDYLKSQINWAANSAGQPGSSMKPFTLAAALKAGFSLKDTFDGNSPYVYPDGAEVHNEGEQAGEANGHSYGARINAIYAMEQSVNTAFIDMTQSIPDGPKKIWETARAAGIPPAQADKDYPGIPMTSGADFNPGQARITLGIGGVSPINMANGYATLAAGGQRSNVHVISKVVDRDGTVLYQYKDQPKQVIDKDIDDDVVYALQQVVQAGTGRKATALGRPAAGKTGTATAGTVDDQHVSSAWFVGFTPQLSTAVMYVRGKGHDALDGWMPSYFGADYPTETWTAAMKAELEGKPVEKFPPPAYVDGTAPSTGHQPTYAPPPAPPAPKKSSKPKPKHDVTIGPPIATDTPPAPTTEAPTPTPTTEAPVTTPPATGQPTTSAPPTACGGALQPPCQ